MQGRLALAAGLTMESTPRLILTGGIAAAKLPTPFSRRLR
jgi:hypothetical protein